MGRTVDLESTHYLKFQQPITNSKLHEIFSCIFCFFHVPVMSTKTRTVTLDDWPVFKQTSHSFIVKHSPAWKVPLESLWAELYPCTSQTAASWVLNGLSYWIDFNFLCNSHRTASSNYSIVWFSLRLSFVTAPHTHGSSHFKFQTKVRAIRTSQQMKPFTGEN